MASRILASRISLVSSSMAQGIQKTAAIFRWGSRSATRLGAKAKVMAATMAAQALPVR